MVGGATKVCRGSKSADGSPALLDSNMNFDDTGCNNSPPLSVRAFKTPLTTKITKDTKGWHRLDFNLLLQRREHNGVPFSATWDCPCATRMRGRGRPRPQAGANVIPEERQRHPESRTSQLLVQIPPLGVVFLYQLHLPTPLPALDQLLTLDGLLHGVVRFVPY